MQDAGRSDRLSACVLVMVINKASKSGKWYMLFNVR